ncbi:uncharacterized protein SPPG_02472 [Spizellomyces punctatus DAOM BR117]|uniref:Transmembrane 9 superfamily member n=1 Tax=Spizellomyces punctatus (strain DAOM BR117) TaxID=645134 RepID=A0A0L0HMB6_SPIPD|nr:uncharacterized protein SPPG_02472 [Spizellomyces punctatus DAOM BR117]KND01964.1 hypothetical protein SPPG_02472 [Spizellomyces punctatus DAOM BR117]|eukprot:XP_016610003.1 hypothetical protein SPPG_02472 [Spizellomyces punctatus DAOM BR117]
MPPSSVSRWVFLGLTLMGVLWQAQVASSFYLPGVAPRDYKSGERVPLYVNALSSPDTVLPYDYYTPYLKFCQPKEIQGKSESLGSILFGDRLKSSPYELNMLQKATCVELCTAVYKEEDASFVEGLIEQKYFMNWEVDGLPAAKEERDPKTQEPFYEIGIQLGSVSVETKYPYSRAYLNNHYDITIKYHTEDQKTYRVVGVLVTPYSVANLKDLNCGKDGDGLPTATNYNHQLLNRGKDTTVKFSYNVKWESSRIQWGTRWDNYLHVFDPKIHWFSLVNSVVIVLFLTGMVAMILLRALHKDIARYNAVEAQEDAQEDFGWKLVHGDVFRPPRWSMLLAVLVGSGAQLFLMASVTLGFAVLGFLSPSSRGSLSTVMLVFYVLFGSVAGYTSARYYKMFGGEKWKRNVVLTAFLVPGTVFGIFLTLNFFLIGAKSSGAVPFGTMFALMAMWFLVSAPLCFVGAYFGFKKPKLEHPVRTNQIPRQIPEQAFYLRAIPSILMGGILPFGAIFIELYFIMSSIWFNRIYYVFGFLFLVFLILILTCSEVTILMCYFHLCSEDYRWWWRAFLTSGASALYVFLYGVLYYCTRLEINDVPSTILYFGYTFTMSLLFFLLTGTIGFTACFKFVRKIYGSIKID